MKKKKQRESWKGENQRTKKIEIKKTGRERLRRTTEQKNKKLSLKQRETKHTNKWITATTPKAIQLYADVESSDPRRRLIIGSAVSLLGRTCRKCFFFSSTAPFSSPFVRFIGLRCFYFGLPLCMSFFGLHVHLIPPPFHQEIPAFYSPTVPRLHIRSSPLPPRYFQPELVDFMLPAPSSSRVYSVASWSHHLASPPSHVTLVACHG